MKYDKQDQQGKAAFNERNPNSNQQQEPVARSPGVPKTKKDRAQGIGRLTIKIINNQLLIRN
jgi:hypothetical protein